MRRWCCGGGFVTSEARIKDVGRRLGPCTYTIFVYLPTYLPTYPGRCDQGNGESCVNMCSGPTSNNVRRGSKGGFRDGTKRQDWTARLKVSSIRLGH